MDRSPEAERSALPQGRATRAPLALALVALAIVALALVPVELGRRAAEAQRRVDQVVLPALETTAQLALVEARQMARLQAFLFTGDRAAYQPRYEAGLQERDSLTTRLRALAREMDIDVRERLARLSAQSIRWHFENQRLFAEQDGPTTDAEIWARSEETYEELQRAFRELDRAIRSELLEARRARERARVIQVWISVVLLAVALAALLAVARVGFRLRAYIREAERRRAEAVRARREIDAILEATGDGVMGLDLEGRCTSLNRAGETLLGWAEHEVRGRDFHDTFHHSHRDGTPRAREACPILRALRSGGRADADDDVLWRRDGTPIPVRWALRPLVDGTEVRGAVLTITDMTEVRRALEQRDEVVSIVSHDLRNPLGVIAGAADLLLELPLGEEERRAQAEIIARSATRMSRLIEDLLDVSRIEAGALVVRAARERAAELLEEARLLYEPQAGEAGISLEVECVPPDLSLRVDRDRVLQALANLVENALRYTPAGGRVVLRARPAASGGVELEVSDTGQGIEPETLEHLFDRFWQAQHGRRGTAGLGLSIVRGIVRAHGGDVRVTSEVGAGSTFTLSFPDGGPGDGEGAPP